MSPQQVDEFSHRLGGIEAKLEVLEDSFSQERASAAQHRSDLRVVIASQASATLALTADVKALTAVMSEIKVLTDDYRERRAEERGAVKVVMFFRGLVIAMAGTIAWIVAWLQPWHGKP